MPVPRAFAASLGLFLGLFCLSPAMAQPASAMALASGTWINPHGTVAVKAGPCNDRLCGWVSWASAKALEDARSEGVTALIGTELLQDYRLTSTGKWTGRVYVPDRGETYYSTIQQVNRDQLKISGCILHGWLCKSQLWHRIAE